MNTVTFYTRTDCRLCDAALFVIERVRRRIPFTLDIIDIDDGHHPTQRAQYTDDVPVINLNGREICRHRIDERDFTNMLIHTAQRGQ